MNKGLNAGKGLKEVLHEIIFEADTVAGKWFDVFLIFSIIASIVVVMADSVGAMRMKYGTFLVLAEWFFTLLFTVEYSLRLYSVRSPLSTLSVSTEWLISWRSFPPT